MWADLVALYPLKRCLSCQVFPSFCCSKKWLRVAGKELPTPTRKRAVGRCYSTHGLRSTGEGQSKWDTGSVLPERGLKTPSE